LASAKAKLADWERALERTVKDQVENATPGAAGKSVALDNARQLEAVLHPTGGAPIDVTTGKPMTTPDWATDHIMPRAEIARDPLDPRLSPVERDAILKQVPENYLPLTTEANSQKGDMTMREWIAYRDRLGEPLPKGFPEALTKADARARAAIEAFFL